MAPRTCAVVAVAVIEDDRRPLSEANAEALAGADNFTGKLGQVLLAPGGDPARVTALVGVGHQGDLDLDRVRAACGAVMRTLSSKSVAIDASTFAPDGVGELDVLGAVADGALLGAYTYDQYKSRSSSVELESITVVSPHATKDARSAVEAARIVSGATYLARDLANRPGSDLTAEQFASAAQEAASAAGISVQIWGMERLRDERMNGLLAVNRGSTRPAQFVRLAYDGRNADTADLALVGKGVTFDSGGLSLKQSESMVGMKGDMAGAAAVLAAFVAVAGLDLPIRLRGFIPLTDNMPGPDALRVGDVITYRNGRTVEVVNTDAEGRLILADALCIASEEKPAAVVDLATLTGACIVALGEQTAGLMSPDDELAVMVEKAGRAAGEPLWRLPLPGGLRQKLDSPIADMRNIPDGRFGGALAAGLFLKEFVAEGIPWAHLDIAGPADAAESAGEVPRGATGFGVRTLTQLARAIVARDGAR